MRATCPPLPEPATRLSWARSFMATITGGCEGWIDRRKAKGSRRKRREHLGKDARRSAKRGLLPCSTFTQAIGHDSPTFLCSLSPFAFRLDALDFLRLS